MTHHTAGPGSALPGGGFGGKQPPSAQMLLYTTTRLLALLSITGCKKAPEPASPPAPVTQHRQPLEMLTELEDQDPDPNVVRVSVRAAMIEGAHGLTAGYNGLAPGPLIRAQKGQRLVVELTNDLPNPTTIHWHGLKVPFEMDGVAWMGAPVAPGERFTYEFELNQAGTFWYHPHFDTERQVDLGLYGAVIVEDPADPAPEHELVLIFDTAEEFDASQDDLPVGDPGRHAHGHGQLSRKWLINGQPAPVSWTGQGGQRVRVRLINVSSAGYLDLSWPDMVQIASDQGLLPAEQAPERIILGPGDRADAVWRLGQEGFAVSNAPHTLNGGAALGEATDLVEVTVENPSEPAAALPWPYTGEEVSPDPGYADIVYAFSGSDRTGLWLINGERFPQVSIETLKLGSEAIIEVRNLSPTEHPFHIHGLDFEILSVNGVPPAWKTVEDTFNLAIRDRVRMKIVADNPGDWMTHCHILPHADDGMMTVLRVEP